ncbi:hypothetical protein, partial [Staphylococcus hominis]|uniref:hypothetical protein n=1 Tax=Staphylococcus hominis TaxID=1290 RepID=UPI001C9313B3
IQTIQKLPYHLQTHKTQLHLIPITSPPSSNPIQKLLNKTTPLNQPTLNLATQQPTIHYYPPQTHLHTLIPP